MTINNGGEEVQISGGSREPVDGRTDRFVWFYIGSNTNLFYLNGLYYSQQPTVQYTTSWTNVATNDNYKSGILYTLNSETGNASSSSGGALNFNTNYYANSYVDPDTQYVLLTDLTNSAGDSVSIYYYNGYFYTQPPTINEDYTYDTITCTSSNPEGVEGRFYVSGGNIRSNSEMANKNGALDWYYAGWGNYYVATASGAGSRGPIICYYYSPSSIDPETITDWEYTGEISQRSGGITYYMDFGSGSSSQHNVYYEYEGYIYSYSSPSTEYRASGTYYYTSGNTEYQITFSSGQFSSHQTEIKTYAYVGDSDALLTGQFETDDDYNTGEWRYTFSSGILTNFEEWGTSYITRYFSDPTTVTSSNPIEGYTNFYFWAQDADISTSSSGSPNGNRITIYSGASNGMLEIWINENGLLETVRKRNTPTADYSDRFMFRCNHIWFGPENGGSWTDDGLIFVDGLLWKTSTHLGE